MDPVAGTVQTGPDASRHSVAYIERVRTVQILGKEHTFFQIAVRLQKEAPVYPGKRP